MKILKYITIVTVLLTFSMAQPMGEHSLPLMYKSFGAVSMMNSPHPNFQDRGPSQERMEMMMTWKLTEDLSLTPEQADKFFPLMRVHRENVEKIDNEILSETRILRNKVKDGKEISDSDISKIIDKVHELEKRKIDERIKFMKDLESVLDITQRAKFITFKNRFTQDLREQIRTRPGKR